MDLKLLAALLAGILVISHVYGDDNASDLPVAGLPIMSLALSTDQQQEKTSCGTDKLFDCKNCTSRAICDSEQNILSVIACGSDAPFCNDGLCSTEKPTDGCPTVTSPLCPSKGTFPSPSSCTRYVVCNAARKATEYQCPPYLVFDHENGYCKRRTAIDDCPNINCVFNRNKFIVYPANKRIYFFCGASNNDIKVLECPENQEFNPTAIICEKQCEAAGFLAAADKSKYYLCVPNGTKYDKYLQSCPNGQKFDELNKECSATVSLPNQDQDGS